MGSFCPQGSLYRRFVTFGRETNTGCRKKVCLPGLESFYEVIVLTRGECELHSIQESVLILVHLFIHLALSFFLLCVRHWG